jgi:hypothetical protein
MEETMKKGIIFLVILAASSALFANKVQCERVGNSSSDIFKCSAGKGSIVYHIDKVTAICFAGIDGIPESFTLVECSQVLKRSEIAIP